MHGYHFQVRLNPELRGRSLEGEVLRGNLFRASKRASVSWRSARERFQEAIPLPPLGLSVWKLSEMREIYALADING